MSTEQGVPDANEGAPDEHGQRSNVARRTARDGDGSVAGLDAPPRTEPDGRIHRLHPDGDPVGRPDDGPDRPGTTRELISQEYHQVTVRESPWLPPEELRAYNEIDPEFARGVMETVRATQDAQIEAHLAPVRAEAWAFKNAAFAVAYFPWVALVLAAVLALAGQDVGALIAGLFGAGVGGVQIIQAVRRPHPGPPQPQPAPTQQRPKKSGSKKSGGKKRNKSRKKR